jgi:hypothetical protein
VLITASAVSLNPNGVIVQLLDWAARPADQANATERDSAGSAVRSDS